jgi:HemY protein
MTRLLWLLLAAALGVLAAGLVAGQPGYVLLAWGDWRVEIRSLVLALLALLLLFGVLHWLLGSAARARQVLWRGRLTRQLRRREQSEADLADGVLALLEGRHAQAQKLLQRSRRGTGTPVLQALALAHLAKLRGDPAAREREFAAARAAAPQAQPTVLQLQAQAQLDAGDSAAAAHTLRALADHDSPRLLQLAAQLARQRRDWQELQDLLPRLRRAGAIDNAEMARQEIAIACERLVDAPVPDLVWPQLARRLRREGAVQLGYAAALGRAGRHDAAQETLAQLLREHWQSDAMERFGHYEGDDTQRWLELAEGWLADHANDAPLLLALGRLAHRAGQWSKARAYYESSLVLAPSGAGHLELAQLLERLGDAAAAGDHYRAGLRLVAPAVVPEPAPAASLTVPTPATEDRPR